MISVSNNLLKVRGSSAAITPLYLRPRNSDLQILLAIKHSGIGEIRQKKTRSNTSGIGFEQRVPVFA